MCSRPYDKTSQGTRIQFNLYRQLSEYQANKKNTNVVSYPLGKLIATANTAKWKSEQHASGLWIEYRQLVRAGSRKAFQNHLDHGRWETAVSSIENKVPGAKSPEVSTPCMQSKCLIHAVSRNHNRIKTKLTHLHLP